MSIAALSAAPILHAYVEAAGLAALDVYRDRAIELRLSQRDSAIAFAYFHPLSTPHLEPKIITRCEPLVVRGDTVLRFGFVEGDALVFAERAVFDPQGWRDPREFHANGSEAGELALVLNAAELRTLVGAAPVDEGARDLIRSKRASVVVVKRGIRGATVADASLQVYNIPAFRSDRVFKIGTGDIFSATFAHYWGEERCSPQVAARQASLAVAHYAARPDFAASSIVSDELAVGGEMRGRVTVIGTTGTVGSYYTREEAVFRLRELGVEAFAHVSGAVNDGVAAALVLADGLTQELADEAARLADEGIHLVLLQEGGHSSVAHGDISDVTDDFTTALYRTAWAASALEAI